MTTAVWLSAGCLAGAAVVAGLPYRGWRARWRLVIGARTVTATPRPRPEPWRAYHRLPPQRLLVAAVALAGGVGAVLGGPVAALAGGAYGGLAVRAVLRRQAAAEAARARSARLDSLSALAADLRAGLPAPLVEATRDLTAEAGQRDRITALTRAACRLAERTGAPLADLVERIEADARAMDRAVAAAAAQAAGARATAWLLAGLPLGGIALGYGIGVDPLAVLLHTPVGAGCAAGAIGLQVVGLHWTERLGAVTAREM